MLQQECNKLKWLINSAVGLDRSPAPACFVRTGWDTCPVLLAQLTLLALKVLLNATQKVKYLKDLKMSVGHTQSTLVGYPRSVLLDNLNFAPMLRNNMTCFVLRWYFRFLMNYKKIVAPIIMLMFF